VKQVEAKEYIAVFPDKNFLGTFSKISEILLSIHGIKIKVLKSSVDPDASEMLQTSWIKIFGLPTIACKEEVVMKVTALAGEPLVVDELSLIKEGPMRVKMNCRDPYSLRGFVKIFFNMVGYDIKRKPLSLLHHLVEIMMQRIGGRRMSLMRIFTEIIKDGMGRRRIELRENLRSLDLVLLGEGVWLRKWFWFRIHSWSKPLQIGPWIKWPRGRMHCWWLVQQG
jgi:hypothetical protein